MNTRSIRFRLVAWYAGLLVIVFVILGGRMYGGLKLYLEQSLRTAQIRRAQQIADIDIPSRVEPYDVADQLAEIVIQRPVSGDATERCLPQMNMAVD